jgi:cysteine desulfurase
MAGPALEAVHETFGLVESFTRASSSAAVTASTYAIPFKPQPMSVPPISYLDHAATSPVLPVVLEEMLPWFTSEYGNPSSVYGPGRKARHALESYRVRVAEVLGVGPAEIVFTSGGSESNNTVLSRHAGGAGGAVTSSVEHEAVLEPVRRLERHRILSPDREGRMTCAQLEREEVEGYGLASFMLVNNELGTINPIVQLAEWCKERGMLFHTDAAQAARTIDLRPVAAGVDYLSLTGHKFGAPKGIGLLYVRAGAPFAPLIRGGGQEQERRSGTENVAFAAGITRALEEAVQSRESFVAHAHELRAQLLHSLRLALDQGIQVVSPEEDCSPHILNLLILGKDGKGVDGEMLILGLDIEGVAVSAGSACSSGTMKVSHVMEALDIPQDKARGALRLSFGPQTTGDDVERTVRALTTVVGRMGT